MNTVSRMSVALPGTVQRLIVPPPTALSPVPSRVPAFLWLSLSVESVRLGSDTSRAEGKKGDSSDFLNKRIKETAQRQSLVSKRARREGAQGQFNRQHKGPREGETHAGPPLPSTCRPDPAADPSTQRHPTGNWDGHGKPTAQRRPRFSPLADGTTGRETNSHFGKDAHATHSAVPPGPWTAERSAGRQPGAWDPGRCGSE